MAYSQPMFFVTKGVALRSFADECKRQDSDVRKHSEDFTMVYLGTFDDQSGRFLNTEVEPEAFAKAADFVEVDK